MLNLARDSIKRIDHGVSVAMIYSHSTQSLLFGSHTARSSDRMFRASLKIPVKSIYFHTFSQYKLSPSRDTAFTGTISLMHSITEEKTHRI